MTRSTPGARGRAGRASAGPARRAQGVAISVLVLAVVATTAARAPAFLLQSPAPDTAAPGGPGMPEPRRPDMTIGTAERNAILQEVSDEFKKRYVFSETTIKVTNIIEVALDFNTTGFITSAAEFADTVTAYLQRATGDKHCSLRFEGKPATHAQNSANTPPPGQPRFRPPGFTAWNNYGVQRAEVLPGNIGYINLRNFAEPESAAAPFAAAMRLVNHTRALILDLRQNGGGDGSMVAHALRYFVGPRQHLVTIRYVRKGTTEESFTPDSVPGPEYGARPLYVLTSAGTFSAAEECAYDLQALKRATLVGETTGGGANPNEFVPLSLGFMMSVAVGQVQSAITRGNWEGHGVEPDVPVPAERALRTAQVMALQKAMQTEPDSQLRERMAQALEMAQDSTGAGREGGRMVRHIVR